MVRAAARPLLETSIMRLLSFCLAALVVAACAAGAEAQSRREPGYTYITVESRYSTRTISGPVRVGPQGRLEVRLPGGTWLGCGMSCRETLRRETIDFWHFREQGGDGPGYFRFRF
jgi:hypothetical protein